MQITSRWQQSVILSCIINFCLLLVVGWVTSYLHANANPYENTLMEVELLSISEKSGQASVPVAASAMTVPNEQLSMTSATPAAVAAYDRPLQTEGASAADSSLSTGISAQPSSVGGTSGPVAASQGSGTQSIEGSGGKPGRILPPRVLSKVEPDYPESARRQGVEGVVRVKIEINEQGRADSVWVTGSSGNDALDEAAMRAVRKWRFTPARDENSGLAMSCTTSLSIAFNLN